MLGRDRTAVYPYLATAALAAGWLFSVAFGTGTTDASGAALGNDFLAFHAAARMVALDPAAPIYDVAAIEAAQRALVPELAAGRPVPFLSPPVALLWFRPFAALDYVPALAAWWALGLAAWVAAHHLLAGLPGMERWSQRDLLVAGLAFPSAIGWVIFGQATPFALLIWAATVALLTRDRELEAGATLGLLAFKPQLALGLALPLMLAGRWRALVGGAVTVGLQGALAAWAWPAQGAAFREALPGIAAVFTDPTYKVAGVVSLRGAWALLLGGWSSRAELGATTATTLAILAVLGAAWLGQPWAPHTPAWRARLAGTLALAPLLGVQLYTYDLALLLVPFWLAVSTTASAPRTDPALDGGPLLRVTAAVWVACFVGPTLAQAMVTASTAIGAPRTGLQLVTPAIVAAGVWWLRRPEAPAQ